MEIAIEKMFVLCFLVLGLSHIFQPRAWVEFFIRFREMGAVGSLYMGMLHLPFALLIVSFHNVWQGIPMVVTIFGWAQMVKSTLYLIYPKHGLRMLGRVKVEKSWEFVVAGVFIIALCGLIMFSLWQRGIRLV